MNTKEKINISDKGINFSLFIVLFEEDGTQIAYCPALDLSGYGKTIDEAKQSFEIVLKNYLSYTIEHKTINDELARLGWIKDKTNTISPPKVTKLISSNRYFKDILNTKEFRTIRKNINVPTPSFI